MLWSRPSTAARRALWAAFIVGVAGAVTVVATACTPTTEMSVGFESREVSRVGLYTYEYGADFDQVKRVTVNNPIVVEELLRPFARMPVSAVNVSPEDLVGFPASGFRFVLWDGDIVEVTQVYLAPQDVVVFWPDGEVYSSRWGVALEGYYDDLGETDFVTPSRIPEAELP